MRHRTRETESDLQEHLTLVRSGDGARWGYFIRAESMHGLFTYLEANPGPEAEHFHRLSHGESFHALLASSRFNGRGFWVMDEPEAAAPVPLTESSRIDQLSIDRPAIPG